MKLKFAFLTAAAIVGAFTAVPATAQMRALSDPVVPHPDPESLFTSSDPKLHRNKQAALHIMRELLQCNQWSRADEWLTDKYIQHNPLAASGLEAVKHYFINVAQRQPTATCDKLTSPVVAVQAEGDYVTVLLQREIPYDDDPTKSYTTTWFDTWRFVDGKADQHWDPATLPAAQPNPSTSVDAALQQARDKAAIEQLMWDYVEAIDGWNADAYAATFTEDGSFLNTKGRPALRQMVLDLKKSQDERRAGGAAVGNMHHIMSNLNVEFLGPNRAYVYYYHMTVFGNGLNPPPNVASVGRGRDEVVKVGGKWLIQTRNVGYQHPAPPAN